jgi:hypothetical protein
MNVEQLKPSLVVRLSVKTDRIPRGLKKLQKTDIEGNELLVVLTFKVQFSGFVGYFEPFTAPPHSMHSLCSMARVIGWRSFCTDKILPTRMCQRW